MRIVFLIMREVSLIKNHHTMFIHNSSVSFSFLSFYFIVFRSSDNTPGVIFAVVSHRSCDKCEVEK